MRVVRARNAGACYGVQRALDMALAAVEGGVAASTLGPLIHNPQVVADLAARGVRAVEHVEDVHAGSIVIRSHGVTPAVRRAAEARGLPVVDATCPHVARAQKAAAQLGERLGRVVVVGEAGQGVAWLGVAGVAGWGRTRGTDAGPGGSRQGAAMARQGGEMLGEAWRV